MKQRTWFLCALTVGLGLLVGGLVGGAALAQSSQDMSLLTPQERRAYTQRLQQAATSAERARITAEMNRIVHQRRLEHRRQLQNPSPTTEPNGRPNKGPAQGPSQNRQ